MRQLPLLFLAAGVLGVAAVVTEAAAAAGPAAHHTSAGTAAAKKSLITKHDLGKGWTATADSTSGIDVSCAGHSPSGNGIVETGAASSPTYSGSKIGPFVVQLTSVFATPAQANAYWKRAVTPGLIACARQSLRALTTKGVTVKILSAGALAIDKVTSMTAGYRVVAALGSASAKGLKTYVDWVLVGHGNVVTEIMISSLRELPAKYGYALAVIADHHVAAPSA